MTRTTLRLLMLIAALAVVAAGCSSDTDDTATFDVSLSGEAEIPDPGSPDGTGDVTVTITDAEVCIEGSYDGAGPLTAGHIHTGAADEAGDVVVDLGVMTDGPGAIDSCGTADTDTVQSIIDDPSTFYVNLHTEDFPAGAIRGQLG